MNTVEQRLDEHWAEIVKILRFKGTPDNKAWVLEGIQPLVKFEHVTPGERRAHLDQIAKNVSRVVKHIDEKSPSLRRELDLARKQLVDIHDDIRRLRGSPVARSGNSQRTKALNRQAAEVAYDMVFQWAQPTLTVGGPWFRLTEVLIRIATNRDPGGVFQACHDCLMRWEAAGVTAEDRREARKAGWYSE
jgi:hypothetical protein